MELEIIGAESLGVRSLCTVVQIRKRKIIIDPGIALGYRRYGLLPHPVQVETCGKIRKMIAKALEDATDIVISHFHGDHIPLVDANPYQLSVERVADLFMRPRLWTKGIQGLSLNQARRARAIADRLDRVLPAAEGITDGSLTFSLPVPHGKGDRCGNGVMMTRIEEEGEIFVHASDIQMLNDDTISKIVNWRPNIVFASGPPIYLPSLSLQEREDALHRILQLTKHIDTLILDHHLMRSRKGEQWLDYVSSVTSHRVICAADFMGLSRSLLEAERVSWYKKLPVPAGWHEAYARGEIEIGSEWSERVSRVRVNEAY